MRRLIALAAAAAVLLVLTLAQLLLPGIAAQRLRDELARRGTVLHVEVHAFPAIELLWHHADRAVVRMGSYRAETTGGLSSTLDRASDVGTLDASASTVTAGLLTLRDARLRKRGRELTGTARIAEADLRASIPFLDSVQPVASADGRLTVRGTASLFGLSASVDATVVASGGRLLIAPDVPFGGLATVTVFSDPHLHVGSVSANPTADGFVVSATARTK